MLKTSLQSSIGHSEEASKAVFTLAIPVGPGDIVVLHFEVNGKAVIIGLVTSTCGVIAQPKVDMAGQDLRLNVGWIKGTKGL